ncbi:MAG: helix-turn-helix transcriptional regulator [Candidatus Riflebacteria bacterium]|nr:helix-turn-helix transcriptional regulator [Candidatus Riflebacteria bacterium]
MKTRYTYLMPRRLTKPRPKQGEHLFQLRQEAGISQKELAELIGETQQNVAFWEQAEKPPRSDVLPKLAKALGVRIEDVLNTDCEIPKKSGPVGRMKILFEEAAKLPRRQQEKLMEFIIAFVSHYKQTKGHPQEA